MGSFARLQVPRSNMAVREVTADTLRSRIEDMNKQISCRNYSRNTPAASTSEQREKAAAWTKLSPKQRKATPRARWSDEKVARYFASTRRPAQVGGEVLRPPFTADYRITRGFKECVIRANLYAYYVTVTGAGQTTMDKAGKFPERIEIPEYLVYGNRNGHITTADVVREGLTFPTAWDQQWDPARHNGYVEFPQIFNFETARSDPDSIADLGFFMMEAFAHSTILDSVRVTLRADQSSVFYEEGEHPLAGTFREIIADPIDAEQRCKLIAGMARLNKPFGGTLHAKPELPLAVEYMMASTYREIPSPLSKPAKLTFDYFHGEYFPSVPQFANNWSWALGRDLWAAECLAKAERRAAAGGESDGQYISTTTNQEMGGLVGTLPSCSEIDDKTDTLLEDMDLQRHNPHDIFLFRCRWLRPNPVSSLSVAGSICSPEPVDKDKKGPGVWERVGASEVQCCAPVSMSGHLELGQLAGCPDHPIWDLVYEQLQSGRSEPRLDWDALDGLVTYQTMPAAREVAKHLQRYFMEYVPHWTEVLPNKGHRVRQREPKDPYFRIRWDHFWREDNQELEFVSLVLSAECERYDPPDERHYLRLYTQAGKPVTVQLARRTLSLFCGVPEVLTEVDPFWVAAYQHELRRHKSLQIDCPQRNNGYILYQSVKGTRSWTLTRSQGATKRDLSLVVFMWMYCRPSVECVADSDSDEIEVVRNGIRKYLALYYASNPNLLPGPLFYIWAYWFPQQAAELRARVGQRLPIDYVTNEMKRGLSRF